jgi:hypothetical protein
MKHFLWIIFLLAIGSIFLGFVLPDSDTPLHLKTSEKAFSEKLIGFGVLGLFFVFMPIFLVHRWKGKQLKDYTLTAENFEKMRENGKNLNQSKEKPSA